MLKKPVYGIMQPYFFPYFGHFSLIAAVDKWIVFDITQYTPKTWMNRNRILHPKTGWQYVTVPLRNGSISVATHEVRILETAKTHQSILGKLTHYKNKAPFYKAVMALVDASFDANDDSLVHLNSRALAAVCRYLDLPFEYQICSEMNLQLPDTLGPGEWALEIAAQVGAGAYLNPVSGKQLFDPARFAERHIDLAFWEPGELIYPTGHYLFEPGLSILDVLMWNPPEKIAEALRSTGTLHPA